MCVAVAPEVEVDVDAHLARASAVGRAGVPVRVCDGWSGCYGRSKRLYVRVRVSTFVRALYARTLVTGRGQLATHFAKVQSKIR